jgi:hypothetical protein
MTSSRNQRKQVIAVRLSRIHSRVLDIYTLAQGLNALVLMLMLWCNRDAHGMVQGDVVIQCRQVLVT